ncbi:XdhC family protein [Hymenobacter sp. BT175]|uniref:XdhC family protein n=1 Tax=Hymenobacter translucens TaxID=2886507 RepID=UPI001D0DD416|nr:XdhC/CoxI family protein [Hymenobacter translucens]MCC2545100.1 XdhC family protein [Hymenobacter translucens]
MNRALAVWQLISASLADEVPVMLLQVVGSQGSSPGRQGFRMAVNARGEMQGSIGGGIMEHKFVQLARERLTQSAAEPVVRRQVHNKTAPQDQSGMICSGEQTIALYPMQVADAAAVAVILRCLEQEGSGTLTLSADGLGFSAEVRSGSKFQFEQAPDGTWQYAETLGLRHHLHIIGGGHCSLALSGMMRQLNFRVHLYEDRAELNTFLENGFAHQKTAVGTYAELAKLIPAGPGQYVVIMTFGYRTDDVALRALLTKELRFLGVLGSGKKIEKMLADYRAEGIDEALLTRLHAPVGLPIHSQTPEEIAVSIAAQLIAVRNAPKS